MNGKPCIYSTSGAKISQTRVHLVDPSIKVLRLNPYPKICIQEDDVVLVIAFDDEQHLERFLRKKEAMSYLRSTKRPAQEEAETSSSDDETQDEENDPDSPPAEEYIELATHIKKDGVSVLEVKTADLLEWRCQECAELLGFIHGHRLAYTNHHDMPPLFVGLPAQCVCSTPGCGEINRVEAAHTTSPSPEKSHQDEADLLRSFTYRREDARRNEEYSIEEFYRGDEGAPRWEGLKSF